MGHLPLVTLTSGVSHLRLRRGQIRALSFDEWYALDGSFAYRDRQYDQTAPCFAEFDLSGARPVDEQVAAFRDGTDEATASLGTCYWALMLVTAARLPMPALSVAYLALEGNDLPDEMRDVALSMQVRRVGPAQRELIVHGDQHVRTVVDEEACADVDRLWLILEARAELVEPVLEALARTSRPGFTPLNEALHLVAGLETLLVERGEPLIATFARRSAVLAAEGDVAMAFEQARYLYGLRSDVIHGRSIPTISPAWEEFLQGGHRWWTCLILRRVLYWLDVNQDSGMGELRASLDRAWDSPEHLAAIRSTWHGCDD